MTVVVAIVDQMFILCQERFSAQPSLAWRQRYYLGAAAVLASAIVVVSATGALGAVALPAGVAVGVGTALLLDHGHCPPR